MKLKHLLYDKLYLIILAMIIYIIMITFLIAVNTSASIIYVLTFLFWGLIIIILIVEFTRRKSFYKELLHNLYSLDKKYLLTNIMKKPSFYDGALLYEVLQITNKSMTDHVNLYKIRQQDYKEYIEMWVHEVKTPLAASKLIITNHENAVTKSIDEELDKLDILVNQALFYARSSSLEKDYIIKKMILKNVVHDVIHKHAKVFIYQHIKIDLQNLDVEVYTDYKWLSFILDQILLNALKYTPSDKGIIKIYSQKQKNTILLFITDNGIGITEKDLPRVFDRGFTGQNGRNNEKATGMGLYLCKELCKKLNLQIQVKSHQGTTVIISFPLDSTISLIQS